MPKAVITINHIPGQGITMEGSGTFTPGDNSLVERLSLAAIAAMDEVMKEQEDAGEFGEPIVAGDDRTIEKSVYSDATRIDKANGYWR